ncbi:hypothetical protein Tco_1392739, partial [Tanacetum coccineum]
MVYDDGGVGGGESRVRESKGGDRIDRRIGSLFCLRRICPPEKFSGGDEWWPAVGGGGRIFWRGGRGVEELKRNVWIKGLKKEALHTAYGKTGSIHKVTESPE